MMDERRRRRRHLEPDDLPEGALARATPTTSSSQRCSPRRTTRRRSSSSSRPRTSATPATSCGPSGRRTDGLDGYVSMEVDPTLAYDTEATVARGRPLPRAARAAEPLREDPRDEAGPAGDRGHDREGQVDQRHADLLARALRRGGRGVHPRARAPRRSRRAIRAPSTRSRASSSPASTPRPTGGSTRSAAAIDLQGQARRSPTPGSPTSATASSSRRALGVPRVEGRPAAAVPLGVDVDEEPGLPGRALRRGADRPGDRQHDARGDDRAPSRITAGSLATLERGVDEARRLLEELAEAGVDYDDVTETLEREGVEKFADSFVELLEGDPRLERDARPRPDAGR